MGVVQHAWIQYMFFRQTSSHLSFLFINTEDIQKLCRLRRSNISFSNRCISGIREGYVPTSFCIQWCTWKHDEGFECIFTERLQCGIRSMEQATNKYRIHRDFSKNPCIAGREKLPFVTIWDVQTFELVWNHPKALTLRLAGPSITRTNSNMRKNYSNSSFNFSNSSFILVFGDIFSAQRRFLGRRHLEVGCSSFHEVVRGLT